MLITMCSAIFFRMMPIFSMRTCSPGLKAMAGGGAAGRASAGLDASGAGAADPSAPLEATGGGGAGGAVAAAVAAGPAAFSPAAPITATTLLTGTVSPSLTLISSSTPAPGDGISASTLSVEISK